MKPHRQSNGAKSNGRDPATSGSSLEYCPIDRGQNGKLLGYGSRNITLTNGLGKHICPKNGKDPESERDGVANRFRDKACDTFSAQSKEEVWNPIVAILFYMASSAGTSCFQKLAITAFKRPLLLLAFQTIVGLVILAWFYKSIHLGSWRDLCLFAPVSLGFTLKVVFSMVAYDYCTLGTYVVISSTCPLFSLPIEAIFFQKNKLIVTPHTVGSILVIIIGVAMYGLKQSRLGGQIIGIVALVLKTAVSVLYQTRQRYLMVEHPVDINDLGMMVYNCGICLFGVLVFAYPFGEYNGFITMCEGLTQREWFFVLMSCFLTYAIGYFSLKCQRVVSATSFHIIGSICKAVVILFGLIVLKEKYNSYSAFACVMVLIGGFWYSWASTNAKRSLSRITEIASDVERGEDAGGKREREGREKSGANLLTGITSAAASTEEPESQPQLRPRAA